MFKFSSLNYISLLMAFSTIGSTVVILSSSKTYPNTVGLFGGVLPRKGLMGYVVHSSDEDGTDTLCHGSGKKSLLKKHRDNSNLTKAFDGPINTLASNEDKSWDRKFKMKLIDHLRPISSPHKALNLSLNNDPNSSNNKKVSLSNDNRIINILPPLSGEPISKYKKDKDTRIILTARGECKFYEKASNAQELGADAIIIGDRTSDKLVTLIPDNVIYDDINIPVLFVGKTTYNELYKLAISGKDKQKKMVQLIPNSRGGRSPNLFIGFGVFLIIIGLLLIMLWYSNNSDDNVDDEINREIEENRRRLLSELPKVDGNNKTCCVCLDQMKKGDDAVKLVNCSHVFHRKCIEPWIVMKQCTCPNCKRPALDTNGDYTADP